MKTIKLSLLLFWAILSLTVGYTALNADGMKYGAGKCGSTMKVQSINVKNIENKSEKKDNKEKVDKIDTQNEWKVLQPKAKYQRGNIQTH